MSGSNKWGWSLNDPALCNSHLGCPAIYPNFLMAYEIIRLDRRPTWSVVCSTTGTRSWCHRPKGEDWIWNSMTSTARALVLDFKPSSGIDNSCDAIYLRGDSYRPTPRLNSSQPSQPNKSTGQGQYSGQCSASGAG